mmetsp:Transcript_28369/g.73388  ORF Transcript_28369/g.73388 Transcript_28369/m.73388 type:complete len:230 (-) Transcript_28369:1732-2421(-)
MATVPPMLLSLAARSLRMTVWDWGVSSTSRLRMMTARNFRVDQSAGGLGPLCGASATLLTEADTARPSGVTKCISSAKQSGRTSSALPRIRATRGSIPARSTPSWPTLATSNSSTTPHSTDWFCCRLMSRKVSSSLPQATRVSTLVLRWEYAGQPMNSTRSGVPTFLRRPSDNRATMPPAEKEFFTTLTTTTPGWRQCRTTPSAPVVSCISFCPIMYGRSSMPVIATSR